MADLFVDDEGNAVVRETANSLGVRLRIEVDSPGEHVDERPNALLARREVERLHEALGRWLGA